MCELRHAAESATNRRGTAPRDIPRRSAYRRRRGCLLRRLRDGARGVSCLGVVTPGSTALSGEYQVVAVFLTGFWGALPALVGILALPAGAHDPRVQFSEPATDPTSTR